MDSSGFSSPRPNCFPAGLRVLVVDDDPTWLKILEKMLKKCNYEVRTCNLAREALDLLRERKDGYDIVISDVNMPDMDGFKLLEYVGLEMDLPVIMMSVDGETSRVMKGVQHGACDYLLKPIRMKELRNIWQHVFRKRIHEVRDIEGHESLEELQMMSTTELSDDGFFFGGEGKKRKDLDHDRVFGGDSSSKKARVVWTVDLHQKFVKAVNLIGFEKVGPKKILDLMGVPWLTRENVASHLQKYRLYLSRLQKENELKAGLNGTKHSGVPPQDILANVCSKIPIAHDEQKKPEAKVKAIEMNDLAKSSTSSITFDHSFRQMNSDAMSEPKIQVQYSWRAGVLPFKQEHKPHEVEVPLIHFKKEDKPPFNSEHHFDHQLPLPLHQIQVDYGEASVCHGTKSKAFNKPNLAGSESSFSNITRSQQSEKVTKVESTAALFSVQPQTIYPIPSKSKSFEQSPFNELESWNRKVIQWEEAFTQNDIYPLNPYLGTADPFSFNAQEVTPDARYDSLKFPVDPLEYSIIDQGVYIS